MNHEPTGRTTARGNRSPIERLVDAMKDMTAGQRETLELEHRRKAARLFHRYNPRDPMGRWHEALADIAKAGPGYTCDDPRLGGQER